MSARYQTVLICDHPACDAVLTIDGNITHARKLAYARHGWRLVRDGYGLSRDLCLMHQREHAREALRLAALDDRADGALTLPRGGDAGD